MTDELTERIADVLMDAALTIDWSREIPRILSSALFSNMYMDSFLAELEKDDLIKIKDKDKLWRFIQKKRFILHINHLNEQNALDKK